MTETDPRDIDRTHVQRVRDFYDQESDRYAAQRYGTSDPSVARPYLERLIFLKEMLAGPLGRCLDLGCGPGLFEPYLLERSQSLAAADISPRMIDKAREGLASHPAAGKLSFFVTSADSLPFQSAEFDTVVCIGVLSYWSNPDRCLEEIARVLRPGGRLVIQGSNCLAPLELESRFLRQPYHRLMGSILKREMRDADFPLRRYVPSRFEARLRRHGLSPVARRHYDFQPPLLRLVSKSWADRLATRFLRFSASPRLGLLATGFLIDAVRDGQRG